MFNFHELPTAQIESSRAHGVRKLVIVICHNSMNQVSTASMTEHDKKVYFSYSSM